VSALLEIYRADKWHYPREMRKPSKTKIKFVLASTMSCAGGHVRSINETMYSGDRNGGTD